MQEADQGSCFPTQWWVRKNLLEAPAPNVRNMPEVVEDIRLDVPVNRKLEMHSGKLLRK